MAPSPWYTLGEHDRYTLADYGWYGLGDSRWYSIARLLLAGMLGQHDIHHHHARLLSHAQSHGIFRATSFAYDPLAAG